MRVRISSRTHVTSHSRDARTRLLTHACHISQSRCAYTSPHACHISQSRCAYTSPHARMSHRAPVRHAMMRTGEGRTKTIQTLSQQPTGRWKSVDRTMHVAAHPSMEMAALFACCAYDSDLSRADSDSRSRGCPKRTEFFKLRLQLRLRLQLQLQWNRMMMMGRTCMCGFDLSFLQVG